VLLTREAFETLDVAVAEPFVLVTNDKKYVISVTVVCMHELSLED
jgi:hypothetical protein